MFDNISLVRQHFTDGNLNGRDSDVKYNKVLTIIGSASKGPVGTPVLVTKEDDIERIWGTYGKSPLSIKVRESWRSTIRDSGVRRIYGVRLGGGQYATLSIAEMTGSGHHGTSADYSIKLTAKNPGYLPLTIRTGIYNGQSSVIVYNPDTGIESVFSYNFSDITDPSVDVHTASELVTALNADPNISSIVRAEMPELNAIYELKISNSGTFSAGYSTESGLALLTLTDKGEGTGSIEGDTDGEIKDSYNLYTNYPRSSEIAGANLLIATNSLYEITAIQEQLVDGLGYRQFTLTKSPIVDPDLADYKLIDYKGLYVWPTGTTAHYPEYRQQIRQMQLGIISDTSTTAYSMPMYLCPDAGDLKTDWDDALTRAGDSYYGTANGYSWADVADSTLADDNTDRVVLYWKRGNASPVPILRSNYTLGWNDEATGGPELTVTFESAFLAEGLLQSADVLLIDVDSVTGVFYEKTTMAALEASTRFYDYFASGRRITFGANLPTPIKFSYTSLRTYTVGENVLLNDRNEGEFSFVDMNYTLGSRGLAEVISSTVGPTGFGEETRHPLYPARLTDIPQCENMTAGYIDTSYRLVHPDSDGGTAFNTESHSKYCRLGFNYTYETEWPNITAVPSTLSGGSDGTKIDNNQKYDELVAVLENLDLHPSDIYVLADMYFDDTRESNNPITGILGNTNAGYHILLSQFIDKMSETSRPCIGVISVKNPSNYTPEHYKAWAQRLTVTDAKDITRSANVFSDFAAYAPKGVAVIAQPVIKSINGTAYITTAEATIAAIATSIASNEGLNHKLLTDIVGLPYPITRQMSEDLSKAKYITAMYSAPYGYVIANDPTAIGPKSDYDTVSTVFAINDTTAAVHDILTTFLGKRFNEAMKNMMQQEVDRVTHEKEKEGVIEWAKGKVYATEESKRIGKAFCMLTIKPAFSLKTIEIQVSASLVINR